MSKRKNDSFCPEQSADLVLQYLDNGEMPFHKWFTTSELTAFYLNKENPEPIDVQRMTNALIRIVDKCEGIENAKELVGISQRSPGKKGSPYLTDAIKVLPSLLNELRYIPDDLHEHCNKILGARQLTKPKQLKPFTSEYFEQFIAVGSIIMIRFTKAKNIKRVQLTEIIYKPDSISEISAVTFGSQSYTLEELKDNLEYFQNDHWLPFGFYE